MSQTVSPSTSRSYGLARVSRAWSVSRAGVYRFLKGTTSLRSPVAAFRQALVRMLTWPNPTALAQAAKGKVAANVGSIAIRGMVCSSLTLAGASPGSTWSRSR